MAPDSAGSDEQFITLEAQNVWLVMLSNYYFEIFRLRDAVQKAGQFQFPHSLTSNL